MGDLFDLNKGLGGDVLNLGGSKESDPVAQKLGLAPPDFKERNNVGLSFQSGLNSINEFGVSLDPRVQENRQTGKAMTDNALSSMQQSRQSALGSRNDFMANRMNPLVESTLDQRKGLQERQAKTGVTGEFGRQSVESFDKQAVDTLQQAKVGAFNEFEKLSQAFDKSEGNLIQMREIIGSNEFAQQAQAAGMSQQLLSSLVDINLTEQGIRTEKAMAQGQKTGTAMSLIGSFFSSRTLKHSMEPIDNKEILDSMMELDVEKWKYNGEDVEHIGCYSEDFNEKFGIKGNKEISVVDIVGVLMASIQAQQEQIDMLIGDS